MCPSGRRRGNCRNKARTLTHVQTPTDTQLDAHTICAHTGNAIKPRKVHFLSFISKLAGTAAAA